MTSISEIAEQAWTDRLPADHHPLYGEPGVTEEMSDGVLFASGFSNVVAIRTPDGLVLVDTSGHLTADPVRHAVRAWSEAPVHTIVYTHGHLDHVAGAARYDAEARDAGRPPPRVVSHEAVVDRFERYVATAGYNGAINRRQFGRDDLQWPTRYRHPDETYREDLTLRVGDTTIELFHARGETDDHTWAWLPEQRILCCGDLFIWSSPNAGNPQKVQRYPQEWATALRRMATHPARLLLPGHGPPVVGEDRVREALETTARYLESLCEQTLERMNDGQRLDEIVHAVRPPAELAALPWLRPNYDEPEFVVRNLWRLWGGWWDGNPAHLKPAPESELARELADMAGGVEALTGRAAALSREGELRLAAHLAELAVQAAPGDRDAHATRAEVLERCTREATSTMARGVYRFGAQESRRIAED